MIQRLPPHRVIRLRRQPDCVPTLEYLRFDEQGRPEWVEDKALSHTWSDWEECLSAEKIHGGHATPHECVDSKKKPDPQLELPRPRPSELGGWMARWEREHEDP